MSAAALYSQSLWVLLKSVNGGFAFDSGNGVNPQVGAATNLGGGVLNMRF